MKTRLSKISFIIFSFIFDISVILAITMTNNTDILVYILTAAVQIIIFVLLPDRDELIKGKCLQCKEKGIVSYKSKDGTYYACEKHQKDVETIIGYSVYPELYEKKQRDHHERKK